MAGMRGRHSRQRGTGRTQEQTSDPSPTGSPRRMSVSGRPATWSESGQQPRRTADIAVGASRASWPTGGPTAGYGRVLVNWTFSVKALFAGQLVRLHRQSAELCGCPYRAG